MFRYISGEKDLFRRVSKIEAGGDEKQVIYLSIFWPKHVFASAFL